METFFAETQLVTGSVVAAVNFTTETHYFRTTEPLFEKTRFSLVKFFCACRSTFGEKNSNCSSCETFSSISWANPFALLSFHLRYVLSVKSQREQDTLILCSIPAFSSWSPHRIWWKICTALFFAVFRFKEWRTWQWLAFSVQSVQGIVHIF